MPKKSSGIDKTRRVVAAGAGAALLSVPTAAFAQGISFGDILGGGGGSSGGGFNLDFNRIQSIFENFSAEPLKPEMEVNYGASLYPGVIAESGGVYPNRKVQKAIKQFADPLFKAAERKDLAWEIVVVNDDSVNAWALPGGKMAVNRGLLRYVDTPEELAGVISHEMGHVELSHHAERMANKQFADGFTDIGLLALDNYQGDQNWSAILSDPRVREALISPMHKLVISGFDRDDERLADDNILKVFAKTGHDPRKAIAFFETLLQLIPSDLDDDFTTSLFSSHPDTRDRMERLADASQGMGGGNGPSKGFNDLKKRFPTRQYFRRRT
ncbi:MAG: M48 family metallopeptidase [Magnetospiraceae bacterium]